MTTISPGISKEGGSIMITIIMIIILLIIMIMIVTMTIRKQ